MQGAHDLSTGILARVEKWGRLIGKLEECVGQIDNYYSKYPSNNCLYLPTPHVARALIQADNSSVAYKHLYNKSNFLAINNA